MKALKSNQKAALAAVLLSLSFASMSIWIRMSADSFDDFQQSYLRILGAAIIAYVVFRKYRRKHLFSSLSRREWSVYGVRAFLGYIFGTAIFTVAINNANLSIVAFISAVPMLGLLAFLMFREKLPLISLPFLAVSMIGVIFMTGANFGSFHLGIGEIAAIVSNVGFSVSFLMARMHDKKRNNFENTTILLLIGWIPIFIISLLLHENVVPQSLTIGALIGLVFAAVFNVINLYGANYVFNNMKAYAAGNILLLETVWASLIGLTIFAEPITLAVAAGGMLIVACALVINKIDKKDEEALAT